MKSLFSAALLVVSVVAASDANAYFVRPYAQLGGSVIDGLTTNGATSRQEGFANSVRSQVDLGTGTVKAIVDVTGPDIYGSATGVFGDTLTFRNDTGNAANVDFSFAFDGDIDITGVQSGGTNSLNYGLTANFFVFGANSQANYSNFTSIGGELIGKTFSLNRGDTNQDVSQFIDKVLGDSLQVGTGLHSFNVFASLSLFAATNLNPVTATLDFQNTATFGIDAPTGVIYSSGSGVFLDSQVLPAEVPEPPMYALLALGLMGLLLRRRLFC